MLSKYRHTQKKSFMFSQRSGFQREEQTLWTEKIMRQNREDHEEETGTGMQGKKDRTFANEMERKRRLGRIREYKFN